MTFFASLSGSRNNKGNYEDVRPMAVYVGAVGARFERRTSPGGSGGGQMEWQEMAITKKQNTPGKSSCMPKITLRFCR